MGKRVGESLNKVLLSFMNRTLVECLQEEESPREIAALQAEIFLGIGLKMNEHQLRKFIIDLVRWSEAKSEMEDGLSFNYRKIAVAQIYCLMAESLQSLFNPFYGYIFDGFLKDLQTITKAFEGREKSGLAKDLKRQREANS